MRAPKSIVLRAAIPGRTGMCSGAKGQLPGFMSGTSGACCREGGEPLRCQASQTLRFPFWTLME